MSQKRRNFIICIQNHSLLYTKIYMLLEFKLKLTGIFFPTHMWGEELYTQMSFFCADNFGRSIYSS